MEQRYPIVPRSWSDEAPREHMLKIAQAVNGLLRGETNNIFPAVALTPDATETIVTDAQIHPGTIAILTPKTQSAASAAVFFSASVGILTLHHDADPAEDRTFGVLIFG